MSGDEIRCDLQAADRAVPVPAFRPLSAARLDEVTARRQRLRMLRAAAAAVLLSAAVLPVWHILSQSERPAAAAAPAALAVMGDQVAELRQRLLRGRADRQQEYRESAHRALAASTRALAAMERSALMGVAFGASQPVDAGSERRVALLQRIATLYPKTAGAARARTMLAELSEKPR